MLKRIFDFAVALALVLPLLPVMLASAVLIALHMGSPVLFRQQRPGRHGRPFVLLKFRTMAERRGRRRPAVARQRPSDAAGPLLRRASLDELPQLFNVLKGDMSLVGPRPLLMEYLPLYTAEQMRRHEVCPASPAGPR
jgi:sugar transferase EpsL